VFARPGWGFAQRAAGVRRTPERSDGGPEPGEGRGALAPSIPAASTNTTTSTVLGCSLLLPDRASCSLGFETSGLPKAGVRNGTSGCGFFRAEDGGFEPKFSLARITVETAVRPHSRNATPLATCPCRTWRREKQGTSEPDSGTQFR
jgi:hypothetical protein